MIVAAMIAKVGFQFGVQSVRELTDEAVDAQVVEDVGKIVRDPADWGVRVCAHVYGCM